MIYDQIQSGAGIKDDHDIPLGAKKEAVGPAVMMEPFLKKVDGKVVACLYCGDGTYLKNPDEVSRKLCAMVNKLKPDVVMCGPCFNYLNYGKMAARIAYDINQNTSCLLYTSEPKEIIPQTSHERCVWLIQELLFKESEINLIQLQDRVFISGYSIDNDLKKIRRMISSYSSLKIVRNKNTIYLVGDEADKRKLYKDLLTEETKGNFMNLNSIADLWENFDLLEVKDILEEVCEMNDYYIRAVSYTHLYY